MGAVSVGVVASTHGAHLLRRATEGLHADGQRGSAPHFQLAKVGERRAVIVLFCGDVVGRSGRDAVKKHVPILRQEFALDLVVVNAENAAGGFGLTERICGELYDAGVDILTTGNHVWDQRQIIP